VLAPAMSKTIAQRPRLAIAAQLHLIGATTPPCLSSIGHHVTGTIEELGMCLNAEGLDACASAACPGYSDRPRVSATKAALGLVSSDFQFPDFSVSMHRLKPRN